MYERYKESVTNHREVSIAFDELFSATLHHNNQLGTIVHDYEIRLGQALMGEAEAHKDLERLRANRETMLEEMEQERQAFKDEADESAAQGVGFAERAMTAEALVAEWEFFNSKYPPANPEANNYGVAGLHGLFLALNLKTYQQEHNILILQTAMRQLRMRRPL